MNTKVILFVLVISAILIAGCSTSGGSYNNDAPTGGAVAGGGGCGRFASADNIGCDIVQETATIEAAPGF